MALLNVENLSTSFHTRNGVVRAVQDVSFQLDLRVGAAVFPADGSGAEELMQRADLALYRAKDTGTPVGIYIKGDDSSHRHRLSILGELRRAVESNQLELHYQPKVKAATGKVAGCEALVRWRHPQHGYIPPGEFIPHAERTGAIRSLTSWVMATALNDAARWEREGMSVDVSINVSPVDFADPGLPTTSRRSCCRPARTRAA